MLIVLTARSYLKCFRQAYCALAIWLAAAISTSAAETQANVVTEISLTAKRHYADPFNEVTLDVVFTDPQSRKLRVPAFWAGGNLWKVRYASPVIGTHVFRSECSERADAGLHGVTGKIEVRPYTGRNPLYLHGPVRAAENQRFLQYQDGTPFFWLGDTWWMGLSHRLHFPDEFQQLTADRKEKGFTVIQIVAGLYPDMFPFDPRGANEAGFPWQTNYASIRPEYFDAADKRLEYLIDQGLTPCIVGAWGYFMPWMGVEKMKAHWRYLIARYGAMPVIWCAAGEANLPWYLAPGFPYDDRAQVKNWTEVMRFMRETDPFHRPITIHPTGLGRLSARNATEDSGLLNIDLLQTPHGQRDAVPITIRTVRQSYADKPVLPVIDGEASYEMLGDSLPTEWTRRMFWICLMNGAAGHTYGANGIWQCNRPGDPHGKSPHGGTYGKIPWNEAMRLPGSEQVGFGKRLLTQYAWQNFQPHPEWASFVGEPELSLKAAKWIWFPEGNPQQDAPAAKRFFRLNFMLPEKTAQGAILRVSADDKFDVRLNGELIGGADDWHAGKQFNDVAHFLRAGVNNMAITAENLPASGLIAALEVSFADGAPMEFVSDSAWQGSKDQVTWTNTLVEAAYGGGPWGQIDQADGDLYGPQSTGISDVVRITYAPEGQSVVARGLGIHATYLGAYFDPVSGAKTEIGLIQSGDDGSWVCPAPAGCDHDWVLVLEKKKTPGQ